MNVLLEGRCDGCGQPLDILNVGISSGIVAGGRRIQVCCNGGECWNLAKNQPQQMDLFA